MGYTRTSGRLHEVIFVPYNAKIADITESDTNKHTLDLETALSETRKIVVVMLYGQRISGTGDLHSYPNEGADPQWVGHGLGADGHVIKDGTQRLQYAQTVANDDWDLYCMGYIVDNWGW